MLGDESGARLRQVRQTHQGGAFGVGVAFGAGKFRGIWLVCAVLKSASGELMLLSGLLLAVGMLHKWFGHHGRNVIFWA